MKIKETASTLPELEKLSKNPSLLTSEVQEVKKELLPSMLNQFSLNDYNPSTKDEMTSSTPYHIMGHIMNKFAVINSGTELWLMDVHAADERIKFEMYEKSKHVIMTQQLLQPLEISLSPTEVDFIEEMKDIFKKFGLVISILDPSKILLHSTPSYFDQKLSKEVIVAIFQETLSLTKQEENELVVETPLNKLEYYIVSRLACLRVN